MEGQQKFDFAIIGGGVYGLSIAYHLAKTQKTVALFQRFTIGHGSGSSHGPQRITRSVYQHSFYRDMNTLALKQYWPQMQQILNSKFIYPNEFIYIDDRKQDYERYYKTALTAKTKIMPMSSQQICLKFPSMPYIKCSYPPIVDLQACMIAADDYVLRLAQYLKTLPNVAIFQNSQIKSIVKNKQYVCISTETQMINVQKVVVSAGKWVLDLFPQLNDILYVNKQYLAYLNLQNPQAYQFGRIPSFVYQVPGKCVYTTPDRKNLGFKIGSHKRVKQTQDQAIVQKQTRQQLEKMAKIFFKDKYKGIRSYDQCYYTITKTQDFIIDWIDPQEQQILICSCCSGHGFKFSPLIGKIITDLLLKDKSIQVFESNRYLCQIPYHRGVNLNN